MSTFASQDLDAAQKLLLDGASMEDSLFELASSGLADDST